MRHDPVFDWRLLVAAVIFILASVLSVDAAEIEGKVTDSVTGEPLPLATIQLLGNTSVGMIAGDGGHYRLADLPGGKHYILLFRFVGYHDARKSVELPAADTTIVIDMALEPKPVLVGEIDVAGDPLEQERQVQTGIVSLDARTIAKIPGIAEPDPIRAIQLLPGVQAASDVSSGLYVRGGGPDQTLILLDQVPVYNPTHAFGLFSSFNADALDRVTLYKGAYPATYGGRLGSVLDIRSRPGSTPSITGKGAASTITGRMVLEGPAGDNGSWIMSGRRTYLEPILSAIRTDDNPVPSYYFYDGNGKFTWNGGGGASVEANGYLGRDVLRFTFDEDLSLKLRWGNRTGNVSYSRILTDNLLGTVQASGSEYESKTEAEIFTTPLSFTNRLRDFSLQGDLSWSGGSHTVTSGALASTYDFFFEQNFNDEDQIQYRKRPYDLSLFVEDQWEPSRDTQIRSGVRGRYFSEGGRFFVEPRLSVSRAVSPWVRLKVGGGLYHQYLQLVTTEAFSATDFYLPIDETAEPARSWQAVFGVDWEYSQRYRFSAETYYTDLDNLVVFDDDTPADQTEFNADDIFKTGGEGYATGLELFAERRTGALTGWIGYTLGWSRRRFDEINEGKEFPPKYDRRHDLEVVSTYERGKWRHGATFVYGTGQAFTPAAAWYGLENPATGQFPDDRLALAAERNSARLLPYHRLDISIARRFSLFGAPAEWSFQIFNAYNRRNEWFVEFDDQDPDAEPTVVKMLPMIPSVGVTFDF